MSGMVSIDFLGVALLSLFSHKRRSGVGLVTID